MSRNPLTRFRLLGKSWIAALLLMQLGCSASNDPSVEYQSGSTLNPSGPTAPNNDPLTPPDPRNPVNWFSNGDLESGTGPWYPQGDNVTATRTSAQRHGGTYSLLVQGRSVDRHGAVMPLIKTLPRGEYEASVWVRLAAGEEPAEIRLSLKTQPEGGTPTFTTIRAAAVTADGWTRLSGTFQNNNPGRWGDLTLYVESPDATVSYYVDDLAVVALSNLIINGGIESGILPWRAQGALITQATEQRHSGDYSLLVTGRTATWNGPVMDLPPLSEGRTYQASVWVRLAPGTPATQLNLTRKRTLVGGAEEYNQLGSAQVTDAAWVELAGGFTHVANGALQEHFLYIESTDAGATASFYVDDLELAVPTQLVVNGDVESSLSGWGPFGANVVVERTSTAANTGSYSVRVTNRDAEWQGASFTVAAPQAGDLYQISCHVRMAPGNPDATAIMTIKLSDAVFIEVGRIAVTSASWVQLSGSYLHDADGTETEFTPYIQASVATAEYLIDSCSATQL